MNFKSAWSRRSFLSTLGASAAACSRRLSWMPRPRKTRNSRRPCPQLTAVPLSPSQVGLARPATFTRKLGVTPIININGTVTVIGGSVMAPEVMELMRMGNEHFVLIDDTGSRSG